jgi:putative ABC transport system permease protein
MKYLPYVLKHLRRNWVRTLSTVVAISICIFLFCTLRTIVQAVTFNLATSSSNRLITRHALSLVNNLPLSYKQRMAGVPGVTGVATTSWFGGSLAAKRETSEGGAAAEADAGPDFSNFFPNLAVEAEPYLAMHPEIQLTDDQRREFLKEQRGCIIGKRLADELGWKEGTTFFLESFIPPYRRRSGPFEFVVSAVFATDTARHPDFDTRVMFFHYDYLYEGVNRNVGAGTYTISIQDPQQAGAISKAIDELFENSDAATKTETEAAFRASFVSLAGNLALLLNSIGLAVTFTILLVTANTMSMAVRERRTEIAVLKTLGFGSQLVMALVLGEALVLGALGGVLGIAGGRLMIGVLVYLPFIGDAVRGFPELGLSPLLAVMGFGLALLLGFVAGFVPALGAYRARITDMLRAA